MASKNDGEDLARVETKADSCDSPTASKNKLIQPMPWTSEHHVGQMWRVRDDNGFVVFDTVTRDEAEFIVRACNAHSDLLAALKDCVEELQLEGCSIPEDVTAAIAKAEGR
jgi:hypothetical protein